jgi:outer membrane lipoprotein-sorting protein
MRHSAIFALFALAALVPSALVSPVQAARYPGTYSDADAAALDKISAYLNAIQTLKSNFVQLGPQGQLAQGEFDLAKPGHLRFSYNPPSPIVVVATGGNIYVKNAQLNTVDRSTISDTPLELLLNQNMDLRHDPMVTSVEQPAGALIVHARAATTHNQSNITLVFSYPAIELRQWMVKDNQGGVTTVALTGLQTGIPLPDSLFTTPQKDPGKAK